MTRAELRSRVNEACRMQASDFQRLVMVIKGICDMSRTRQSFIQFRSSALVMQLGQDGEAA